MRHFAITPQDAWFFRDGRPYNHGESNQSDVASLFPPPARTLTGAARAALARANGWSGQGRWTTELNTAFGSGPNELGRLQFCGPYLVHGESQALWPIPRHLICRTVGGIWTPTAFLGPDENVTLTDQGKLNLPALDRLVEDGMKPAENAWITNAGLARILAGQLPEATTIFHPSQLWRHEPRVGLKRDPHTHQVGEGDLYSPSYVRLRHNIRLGISIAGIPDTMNGLPNLFPLGGESRLAQCDVWGYDAMPLAPKHDTNQFTVILLTPGRFADLTDVLPGATVVSACIGKPVFMGGWDSMRNEPLPLEAFHPAGSVWFCTAANPVIATIRAQHGQWFGAYTAHGFGQIVVGHWPSKGRTSKSL